MNERYELDRIMMEAPENRRLFRNNTGLGWAGDEVDRRGGLLVIKNPRPIHAGLCKGSSDLIGWETVVITPEMVGQLFARFLAIEVKTGKVAVTDDQKNFLEQVNAAGGIGELLRVKG